MWWLLLVLGTTRTEKRRTYGDGSVQELWTWDGDKIPENLVRKEWFYEDGQRERLEEYAGGDLHGRVAVWDRDGVLQTEVHWAAGERHGPDREWAGPDDGRWLKVERNWAEGVPSGPQRLRYTEDCVHLDHFYADGQLQGTQKAWEHCGDMKYHLRFDAGVPDGEQRVWSYGNDEPRTWMNFQDGAPHGEQRYRDGRVEVWENGHYRTVERWHVEDEIPQRELVWVMDPINVDRRNPDEEAQPTRELTLWPDRSRWLDIRYHPDGALEYVTDGHYELTFHPNGALSTMATGGHQDAGSQELVWREDGTLQREAVWTGNREGTTRLYDPQARLRSQQIWQWEIQEETLWIYEGDRLISEGQLRRGHRDGSWTYYAGDGSVRRTETYGSGPYSGNRPFVADSLEHGDPTTVRCRGPETELTCEQEQDGLRVVMEVKPLDRSRHGFEAYDEDAFVFVRKDPNPPELAPQAVLVPALDGQALVVVRTTWSAEGKRLSHETWSREGEREDLTRYADDGTIALTATFDDGLVQQMVQPHPEDGVCTQIRMGDSWQVLVEKSDGTLVAPTMGKRAAKVTAQCPDPDAALER